MKLNEKNIIDMSNLPMNFIYFLTNDDNEVVYVGQTTAGMARPYQHRHDKEFSKIYIIPCNKEKLDVEESNYITKYKPIYNHTLDKDMYYSLNRAKRKVQNIYSGRYTLRELKRDMKELGLDVIVLNDSRYIKVNDFMKVIKKYE